MARVYLVDGYNVIYSRTPHPESLERERDALLEQVRRWQGSGRVLVVFDGQHGIGTRGGPGVVFTRGESADEYIRRYVARSARPQEIVVVTRDRPLQNAVKHFGAQVMDPSSFLRELRSSPRPLDSRPGGKRLRPDEISRINRELMDLWDPDQS